MLPVNSSATQWVTIRSNHGYSSNEGVGLCLTLENMNGPTVIWDGCSTYPEENSIWKLGGVPGGGTICTAGGGSSRFNEVRCLSGMSTDPSGESGVPTGIGFQMWVKPQPEDAIAVLVLNNRNPMLSNCSVIIELSEIMEIHSGHGGYNATDIWTGESFLTDSNELAAGAGWMHSLDGPSTRFQTDGFGGHDSKFFLFQPLATVFV